ncbi:MAG: hypothetical protein JW940_18030, partial [Polyangiaceae bacterium]|nr:hypothetical protein [Polyangiaceae bacterium]
SGSARRAMGPAPNPTSTPTGQRSAAMRDGVLVVVQTSAPSSPAPRTQPSAAGHRGPWLLGRKGTEVAGAQS